MIHILIEESYKNNNRTDILLQGICAVIRRKRSGIAVHAHISEIPPDTRIVVLLCASMYWAADVIRNLGRMGIHPLLFGFQDIDTPYPYSCVTPAYAKAMYLLTERLLSEHAQTVAVLGYNADSIPDQLKLMGVRHAAYEHGVDVKVFCNRGDVASCMAEFEREGGAAVNIVCVNDAIAVILHSLYPHLIKHRYVCSCSGMKISEYIYPHWQTSTINYDEAGRSLARLYLFLEKCTVINPTTMTIDMELCPSAEDVGLPVGGHKDDQAGTDFYGDALVQEVETVDHMLMLCDTLDIGILQDVIKGMPYERIAEKHYLAPNTVKYRISAMSKNAEVQSRKGLMVLLGRFGLFREPD